MLVIFAQTLCRYFHSAEADSRWWKQSWLYRRVFFIQIDLEFWKKNAIEKHQSTIRYTLFSLFSFFKKVNKLEEKTKSKSSYKAITKFGQLFHVFHRCVNEAILTRRRPGFITSASFMLYTSSYKEYNKEKKTNYLERWCWAMSATAGTGPAVGKEPSNGVHRLHLFRSHCCKQKQRNK